MSRVYITPTSARVEVGSTVQLTARAYGTTSVEVTGHTVAWTSSNPAVASINSSGVLRGNSVGQATVYATVDGVTASAPVGSGMWPALSVAINGPDYVQQNYGGSCGWASTVVGGTGTYSYEWIKDGSVVGTYSTWYGQYFYYTFPLQLKVTDSAGTTVSATKYVYVSSSYYGCGGAS